MKVKSCSRVAQTHIRVKTVSKFTEDTKKFRLKTGKISQQKLNWFVIEIPQRNYWRPNLKIAGIENLWYRMYNTVQRTRIA
jgi:hypothetical protein